jgi:purine-binding chemotaxis protein CheW
MSDKTMTQENTQNAQDQKAERIAKVDFKMVTFTLAGKDYGIDIMSVKEIAKAGRFTYVPNAATFVRGVYNLRGEIISVIDLRTMFHLPAERKEDDALENLLILQVVDHVFGVIVDNIDKVIGISSESIQPPHPIFGDINVKYIRGVVENQGRLYIILDIAKIVAPKEERKTEEVGILGETAVKAPQAVMPEPEMAQYAAGSDLALNFIKETLFTFKHFGVTPLNEQWVETRYKSWKVEKGNEDPQLKEAEDADLFLRGFDSPFNGGFWGEDYLNELMAVLPNISAKSISVWNPGCGRGQETYSVAVALRKRYPDLRIKIWANDSDLLSISTAPNLVFPESEIPDCYGPYIVQGKSGFSFAPAIRDIISFEYHNILNANPLPDVDLILCRDVLSYMSAAEQAQMLSEFQEKLKPNGMAILGSNENLSGMDAWVAVGNGEISAFTKKD